MSSQKMDLSAFMAILILTIGALVILLVTNVIVILSNPENFSVSTIMIRAYEEDESLDRLAGTPLFSNVEKEPAYVDVHPDRLVIYPGEIVVPVTELATPGNAFERLLDETQAKAQDHYIITVLRPGSIQVGNHLKRAILDRGIDFGLELFDADKPVVYRAATKDEE